MVDNMIDLLRSRSIARAFNPSLENDVKFDCLHLCDFLLSLLNRELSEPKTNAIEEAKNYKGFLRTLKRLDKPLSTFLTMHHSDTPWTPELVKICSDLCTTYNQHPGSKDVGTMNSVLDAVNRKTTVEKVVEMLKRGIPSLPQSPNPSVDYKLKGRHSSTSLDFPVVENYLSVRMDGRNGGGASYL